jgi:hypothetical protein
LFEFIIPGVHQVHVQFGGKQIVTQRFGNAAGVARLRGGDKRNSRDLNGGRRGNNGPWLLVKHSPEIAGHPGKLSG